MVDFHRNTRKSAGSCLREDLRVTFEDAGKEENVRITQLFAKSRRLQMAEKFYVAATQFGCKILAGFQPFANSRNSKAHVGPARGLPYNERDAFHWAQRTSIENGKRIASIAVRLWREKVAAIHTVVDDTRRLDSHFLFQQLSKIGVVGKDRVGLANMPLTRGQVRLRIKAAGNDVAHDRRFQTEIPSQGQKSRVQRAFPGEEIDIRNVAQDSRKNARRIPVLAPMKQPGIRPRSNARVDGAFVQ